MVFAVAVAAIAGVAIAHCWPQQSLAPTSGAGKRIVFFAGGDDGNFFSRRLANGAAAAGRALGAEVEVVWSDWDATRLLAQLREQIQRRPTGIALPAHPGDEALRPLIEEAQRLGVIVTLLNVDAPQLRGLAIDRGMGFVGADQHRAGSELAHGCLRLLGSTPVSAVVTRTREGRDSERGRRSQGVIDALASTGVAVASVEEPSYANFADRAAMDAWASKLLAEHPQAGLLVIDSHQLLLRVIAANPSARIPVAGFDLSDELLPAMAAGKVLAVIDQQPFLQGFMPVVNICLTARMGCSGLRIETGDAIIDRSRALALTPLLQEGIR